MSDKIKIRTAHQDDAGAILEIYSPYILHTPVSFETDIPSLEEFRQRMAYYQEKLPWLVCEIGNDIAGYAYATDHRQRKAYECTKELSVYVHPGFRQRGVATGLYTTLIDILKHQGVTNLLAGIALPNPESVGFHEGFGFRLVGIYHKVGFKLGRYHDAGWWELQTGTDNISPLDIKPAGSIIDTEHWHQAITKGISKIK